MDHAHVRRQQIFDSVSRDCVRMAAAKFHEPVFALGACVAVHCRREPGGQFAAAEFVDVFHGGAPIADALPSASEPSCRISASVCSASSTLRRCSAKPTWMIT